MKSRIVGNNIIYRNEYHVTSEIFSNKYNKIKQEDEYKQILQRSLFSLCPRGSSCSSVRFWESLHAGSIPILISDNWLLPEWDWNNTIIKIKEKEFESMTYNDISQLLNQITPEKINSLYVNTLKASAEFKQDNFKNYIESKI